MISLKCSIIFNRWGKLLSILFYHTIIIVTVVVVIIIVVTVPGPPLLISSIYFNCKLGMTLIKENTQIKIAFFCCEEIFTNFTNFWCNIIDNYRLVALTHSNSCEYSFFMILWNSTLTFIHVTICHCFWSSYHKFRSHSQ